MNCEYRDQQSLRPQAQDASTHTPAFPLFLPLSVSFAPHHSQSCAEWLVQYHLENDLPSHFSPSKTWRSSSSLVRPPCNATPCLPPNLHTQVLPEQNAKLDSRSWHTTLTCSSTQPETSSATNRKTTSPTGRNTRSFATGSATTPEAAGSEFRSMEFRRI